jgi:DNA mismatch repair protein MutS
MCSFAATALEHKYTAPVLDNSYVIDIKDGRHPVVECCMKSGEFVSNDCNLSDQQKLWLITGPNMSGKSTFLRQNALIVLLAHIGSYVPATYARIGIVDRIFSRIGAEDDLAHGRSTFLVEMVETATIINQGTDRSLIILDEVGRGTSTYDGIAIAWSCLEYIHDRIKARTLFSTHYHELIDLSTRLEHLQCFTVRVREWEGKVVFMHKLVPGSANKSYGINVAEIAGLPKPVIDRAKDVLSQLHVGDNANIKDSPPPKDSVDPFLVRLKAQLLSLSLDNMSPKDALAMLYSLKEDLLQAVSSCENEKSILLAN